MITVLQVCFNFFYLAEPTSVVMNFHEAFCEAVQGLTLSFARVNYIADPSSFWLCEVKCCAAPLITARIRRRRSSKVETVHIPVKNFFHRIHRAFAVVSVFWHGQVVDGTQWRSLSPVDETVQRECSWVFGIDTASKGSLLLRMLLRGELGCYFPVSTPDMKIRRSIVQRGRNLPVFQKIIDRTHVVYWNMSIKS